MLLLLTLLYSAAKLQIYNESNHTATVNPNFCEYSILRLYATCEIREIQMHAKN